MVKWIFGGTILLAFSVLLVAALWGGAMVLREMSPGYQQQQQTAAEKEAWEFLQAQRQAYLNEERWGPMWDSLAWLAPYAVPVIIIVVLILILSAIILSSTYLGMRVALGLLNQFQFVAPFVSRQAALSGVTIYLAEKQIEYEGRARIEAERNPGRYLTLSDAPNLRSLNFKMGNQPARPATERLAYDPPVSIPELLPAPAGTFGLDDMGEPADSYDIPYGKTDDGSKVWSNVIGIHRLFGGSTNSGKTNLAQAHVAMLNRHNSSRILANYFIDPKHAAFHHFIGDARTRDFAETASDILRLLEALEAERDRRQILMRNHDRAEWRPGLTLEDEQLPLIALWVDELGTVTEKSEAHQLLLDIVRQGRSAGITFTGISQLTDTRTIIEGIRINCAERACGYVPTFHGSVPILGCAGAEKVPNRPGYFTVKMGSELTVVRAPHAGYLPTDNSPSRPGSWPGVVEGRSRVVTPPEPILTPSGPVVKSDRDQVLDYLETHPAGSAKTPLYGEFHNKIPQARLDAILAELQAEGLVEVYKEPSGGAPRVMTRLKKFFTKEVE